MVHLHQPEKIDWFLTKNEKAFFCVDPIEDCTQDVVV
jgi:hypothetical protein